jgi:hypothetical protein
MFECKHSYYNYKERKTFCDLTERPVDLGKCRKCEEFTPKSIDEIIEELRTR